MTSQPTTDEFICDSCREIDFEYLWIHPLQDHAWSDHQPPFSLEQSSTCVLCEVLIPKGLVGEDLELKSFHYSTTSRWSFPDAFQAISLVACPKGRLASPYYVEEVFYRSTICFDDGPGLLKPQPLGEIPDYKASRVWLHNCRECHGETCNGPLALPIQNLLLIDCDNPTLASAASIPGVRYLALSYVWGDGSQLPDPQTENKSGIWDTMSRTVQDAVVVTKELGYRYL
jgi:hypothetical protein